ncbi:hypothetical protein DPX16_11227 [Anabarilius grahami]|uniref:Uncharacterized protein n=1 Tax=Anabarilius grahami TaxID=495550 RepID=A0A3N0Y2J1_ANAGA|nr:hypothetical protein DPX16_11227 [Anabarilius grahami]
MLPDEIAGPSHGGPSISFVALAEDQMSIAALKRGLFPVLNWIQSCSRVCSVCCALRPTLSDRGWMIGFWGCSVTSKSPCPAPVPFFLEARKELRQYGGKFVPLGNAKCAKLCFKFFLYPRWWGLWVVGTPQVDYVVVVHARKVQLLPSTCKITAALAGMGVEGGNGDVTTIAVP